VYAAACSLRRPIADQVAQAMIRLFVYTILPGLRAQLTALHTYISSLRTKMLMALRRRKR